MSRIPPSLLYFTIYNPTLKPATLHPDPDDEDAEEIAHILFHTAREHAVSRDRILRQVGLAKALVNFSEMFNAGVPCENVHSQARRMVMLSPEPNFWIHACYEVAKTPRQPPPSSKTKDNSKSKSKGKEKEQASRPTVLYDYHDGSVHDEVVRAHFQRGYEGFKLLHGSFTSVLSNLGQQALELQLERFFTVWAWKWDIEDEDFGTHLGIPLHPLHKELTPLLESFVSKLPQELTAFALIPPYVIPPRAPRYPPALVRFVLSRIPPPATPVSRTHSSGFEPSTSTPNVAPPQNPGPPVPSAAQSSSGTENKRSSASILLPLPPMPNMNLGLDMKNMKWAWPGYLTFGKSGTSSKTATVLATAAAPGLDSASRNDKKEDAGSVGDNGLKPHDGVAVKSGETLEVDTASLLEAITTESMGSHTRAASPAPSALSRSSQLGDSSDRTEADHGLSSEPNPSGSPASDNVQSGTSRVILESSEPSPTFIANDATIPRVAKSFLQAFVHLTSSSDPLATEKQRVLHLTEGDCTVAIVTGVEGVADTAELADATVELMQDIMKVVKEDSLRAKDQHIPSATKILQPKDRYIVAMDEYTTVSSTGFNSRSEHLYHGQRLLRSDHDVLEVFSRGQNPQHWYIGKRGLGTDADGRSIDGEAYMEVSRKETTLTDVDNELAGVVRRFIEHL
ncbi:hypothetical protein ONZ51_g3067 [Trametes cubensis]|uniref:CCZ1/INTU/HSP4 first Longin domain-containing protein n=1 Tax=Trametes cubensis TaxID=1111947 RepID=A0AAD7U0T2_9APHY|nr:hypothetical protein ONZ51_g3067 [Trametes cubensis]